MTRKYGYYTFVLKIYKVRGDFLTFTFKNEFVYY